MYSLMIICLFLASISLVTFTIALTKILEQLRIKKERLHVLFNSRLLRCHEHLTQSLAELYTKSYSHYLIYCIGHFSSILIDVYSIILSITSLSMITFGKEVNEFTPIVSLLSTLFITILVFSKLDERSTYHLTAYAKCEKSILQISELVSKCNDISPQIDIIFSLIASCRFKKKPKHIRKKSH